MCMADLLSFLFRKISVDDVSKILNFFWYLFEGERSKSNDVMFALIQIHIMFSSKQTILIELLNTTFNSLKEYINCSDFIISSLKDK